MFHLRCRLLGITWHFPRFAVARLNDALRRRYRHPNYRTYIHTHIGHRKGDQVRQVRQMATT